MNYYELFPKTEYKGKEVVNITRKLYIREEIKNDPLLYFEHLITEDETPEFLALKYYDSASYTWVIFLMNDITDPLFQWPMKQQEIEEYINKKYNDPSAVHHYEKDGFVVHPDYTNNYISITNSQYEERKNEANRNIKILKPEYIKDIERNLEVEF